MEHQGEVMDGWDAAASYPDLYRKAPNGRRTQLAREAAVRAVLSKAAACLRHAGRFTSVSTLPWIERPDGDLLLEESLEAGWMPGNEGATLSAIQSLRVGVRDERRAEVVLMLDMSLSMTGEKIALVAVATAVMAFKLQSADLAVTTFDTHARTLKPLAKEMTVASLARAVLEVPARGYTHLEAGLQEGLKQLRHATGGQRIGVLLSDGVYNVGWDPSRLAGRFPRLHVIQVDQEERDRGLCRRLASLGRGRHYRAERYEDLPEVSGQLLRELFR